MQSSLRSRASTYRPTDQGIAPDDSYSSIPPVRPSQPQQRNKLTKANDRGDSRKSRVGDKIKKRMSMRYADISVPALPEISTMPAMPTLQEAREDRRATPRSEDERIAGPVRPRAEGSNLRKRDILGEGSRGSDVELLTRENFDPDAYLKQKLAHSTEDEIKSLKSSLEATKEQTAADLRRNVFENYSEFVMISKEISTLENDMLELKESLSEWKNMPSLLTIDDAGSTSSATDRRRANRNSVADLRTLYATQIQELHSQIEGSAKFVPAIPGRHIVTEFSDLWALNSATYKIEYAVHVVLLDDSLLVAKKRKKRSGGGGKLVAEKSWALNDINIVDVKDSVDLTNVIKIRKGRETHVFRTDTLPDKKSILSLFRQLSEELAAKKRKEREGEHERRRSVWTGDRSSIVSNSEPMPSLPSWLVDPPNHALNGLGQTTGEKDARWLSDYMDKLAVYIALREWDEAVGLIEQAQNLPITPADAKLTSGVESLKVSLVADLLQDIADPANRKQSIMRLSAYLVRLGAGAQARDAFLSTRAELMRKRARMIRFEGNISLYIAELALVTFTGIRHTSEWYLASFREHDMASGMVDWAKTQIEKYAEMFRRQVFGPDVDPETVQESILVTKLHNQKSLQEIGLDFSFLLDTLLIPPTPPTKRRPSNTQDTAVPEPDGRRMNGHSPLPPPMPLNIVNRNLERARSPIGVQDRSSSPLSTLRSPSAKPPGPLPPRSRERPMSGNVTPKPRDNVI